MTRAQEFCDIAVNGTMKKMQLPAEVRKFFGYALHFAQQGDQHPAAKVLKGFGGAGVLEVVENCPGSAPLRQN